MAYRLSKRADEDISAVLRDGFAKFGIDKTRAYFTDSNTHSIELRRTQKFGESEKSLILLLASVASNLI